MSLSTFRRTTLWTLGITLVAVLLALAMDYVVNTLIRHVGSSSVATAVIAIVVCLPLAYFMVTQQTKILLARNDLLEVQAVRDVALADAEKQAEAARAANEAKSAFLAMISHELRTPLNGVLGMSRALNFTSLNQQQTQYVDMIVRSGEGLMSILNDILDLAKIEAGKLEIETLPFDLHELGQRVCDLWSEAASAKGVSLIYELDPATPRWVAGDPTRLRQILLNLVSNALKFTAEGEVRLAMRPTTEGRCSIAVSDSGAGISAAQQARLFQPFMQAEASTARKFGGTGLGLSICKQLVSAMGGTIELVSAEGQGSTFTVEFALPAAAPVDPAETEAIDFRLEGVRVLVVDDNAINQAVARAVLEVFGVVVTAADDGLNAVARLQVEPFDAVLMDIHMPRMGGVAAVAEIRAGRAGRADMPVIALTADAMVGVEMKLLAAGFDSVAPKPFKPEEILAHLSAALSRSAEAVAPRAS